MASKIIVTAFDKDTEKVLCVTIDDKEPETVRHGETKQFYIKDGMNISVCEGEAETDDEEAPAEEPDAGDTTDAADEETETVEVEPEDVGTVEDVIGDGDEAE